MAPSASRLLYATNHSVALLCVRVLLFPTPVPSHLSVFLLLRLPTTSITNNNSRSPLVPWSSFPRSSKMFIGGLNWDTTDGILVYAVCQPVQPGTKVVISEGLRNYFSQFGKVEACTIMRDAGGRSRCFAFLTFEDPASVNAVMVREHFLDGKIVSTADHHSSPFAYPTSSPDRPQASDPQAGTSACNQIVHRRTRWKRHFGVHAGVLFSIRSGCRFNGHVGPGNRPQQRIWVRFPRECRRRLYPRLR